jgi:hypothetical protein
MRDGDVPLLSWSRRSPAIPFVPAKHYDALTNTPNWNDISRRLGFAWDTKGNGKTVARFNYARYVASK